MEETKKIDFSNRIFILTTALIIGLVVFFIGQMMYQFNSLPQNYPQEITITGEGKVFVKPDVALISVGVKTEEKKSVDAVNKNNEKMNAIIKAVKELGVEEKDIKTSAYNLYPVYDYRESGRVFIGYSLNQQINVKIRNFDKISDILDKATSEGANSISDLQFTIDDLEIARAIAREEAIEKAKAKAIVLANQAGFKIVKLVNISEGYSSTPQPLYSSKGGAGIMMEDSSIAPTIETGQSEINTIVYLTYRVR